MKTQRAGADASNCATARQGRRRQAARWVCIAVLSSYFGYCHAADDGLQCGDFTDRLTAAARRHDGVQEVLNLNAIGHACRWALSTSPRRLIEGAIADSDGAPLEPARLDMLQMLFDVRWRRPDGSEPSRAWRQLSLGLLDRKEPQEAFAVAAHINDPYELIALQVDKRYAPIAKSRFVESDILRASRKELEWRRAVAAANPRRLSQVDEVGRYLLLLHNYEEVLRLTDPVIAGFNSEPPGPSRYDDFETELPWILDLRSRALRALGRHDEALELLRRACRESKGDLVGHALNLAGFLAELNRPQEALTTIPRLDHASPYGRAVAAEVRVMAASELHDDAGIDSALAELSGDGQDRVRGHALIIAGRTDAAATLLLARLSDPDRRTDALVELQDYADPPAPALVLAWRAQAKSVRDRPEVRRVIATFGRVRAYPITTNTGTGF
jgi:tetratricopeptide (TPR) repeat protein